MISAVYANTFNSTTIINRQQKLSTACQLLSLNTESFDSATGLQLTLNTRIYFEWKWNKNQLYSSGITYLHQPCFISYTL